MTLEPLLTASPAIQIHVAAALWAIITGAFAVMRTRRDWIHKTLGYLWVITMLIVSVSTVFITARVGPTLFGFGLIHILSVVVIVSLALGLRAAIVRDIARHRAIMRALYVQSLGITGLFTLLPGRKMNAVLFGEASHWGWAAIVLGGAAITWLLIRQARAARIA